MRSAIAAIVITIPLLFTAACGEATTDGNSAGESSQAEKADKPKKKEPNYTSDQKAAIAAAQNYVDTMPFSRAGLIRQLTSEFDQFSKKDATFAVNHIDVDWNQEAVEAVENYKETMPMSRQAMIDQLASPHGDQFTRAQARQAVEKAY